MNVESVEPRVEKNKQSQKCQKRRMTCRRLESLPLETPAGGSRGMCCNFASVSLMLVSSQSSWFQWIPNEL